MLQARHASSPLLLWDSKDLSIYKYKSWCIGVVTTPCSVDHSYIILSFIHSFIHSFIPLACAECNDSLLFSGASSIPVCYVLCTFSFHPSPPTILPSLTQSCHLFLGLPLNLVVPKFIYNTLLGILFPSILCTCPNQFNLFNLIVSIIVGFLNSCINFLIG